MEIKEDLIKGAKEAAAYLGPAVSPRAVYRLVEVGRLPVIRMGKTMFFRRSQLDAAFRSQAANG